MKFCNRFSWKQGFKQWLSYIRSIYMLVLLALVIMVTGILGAEAGIEDVTVTQMHAGKCPGSGYVQQGLEMTVKDGAGNGRLFEEGVPIRLTEDLYFCFPEDVFRRQIRIGSGEWYEADGDCYRLDHTTVQRVQEPMIEIRFGAYDENGRYREQSFYFLTGQTDTTYIDTENVK